VKRDQQNLAPGTEEILPEGCKESSWPGKGRFVFGPWCLLGPWPATFGMVENIEKKEKE
jgi:hypothetical protein